MEYIVGAYATAPSAEGWEPELESLYYQHLKSEDNIIGIEHPFVGKLHPYDDEWFLSNVSKDWQFVFTSIPGVMGQLANNPHFGIASTNEAGRQAALVFYQQAQQAIMTLNNHLGREAVSFLKIHTAPKISKNSTSSIAALQSSLETMLSWDWHGAKLVIEHCDAYIEGQDAEKGFMRLEDEISAAQYVNNKLQSDLGISINWGRSAIEARSTNGPLQHIELAKQSGLLKGIIFSGASDIEGPYGKWKDTHMPPAKALYIPSYAQGSLLTFKEIENSIQACQPQSLSFIGGKISLQPNRADVEQRVSYIKSLLTLLDHALEPNETSVS
ncbi:DUF4862 family protein [Shewanella pealeana]|uniref:DUF4862 domain-containing protein n=1 Tax=Shewanella pealeana (strain ATCC 700345 / ANG-SQ1) TaxID=398579 RepID=A8H2R2_SHEPA|nr:DUF4862 family protein [Shewanella pealeana]ABV86849.1 conserved hypothetical protein [Shewanella pealeana ATCC 700345]